MTKTDIEALMRPRVRCLGNEGHHFPNSPFAAGEILEVHQDGARLISIKTGRYIDWLKYKRYPHLFGDVKWYEDRLPEEMPEYVKEESGKIYLAIWKIKEALKMILYESEHELQCAEYFVTPKAMCFFEPATEADYLQYINNQNKK